MLQDNDATLEAARAPIRTAEGRLVVATYHPSYVLRTRGVNHFNGGPPGNRRLNRPPAQPEVAACRYWLERELDAVRPRVIVALGGTALRALLQDNDATLEA
ncbi:uracil-DNA glycosylase, partial [Burkholderia sp. Ax-1735]|nr:uracil-DNA glycosylase [Burkholderia sp. Ax-1735]